MDQAKQDETKGYEVAKHKAKEVRKSMLDIGMYLCGFFFAVGGLWLSYLGVFGHLKDQKIVALSVLFGSLFFLLLGGYFYFLKQALPQVPVSVIKAVDPPAAMPALPRPKPDLSCVNAGIDPLIPNKAPTSTFVIRNAGQAPALRIRADNIRQEFAYKDFQGPLPYYPLAEQAEAQPRLNPGQQLVLQGETGVLTKKQIRSLKKGDLLLFLYAIGDYEDETGTKYPLEFCYLWDSHIPTVLRIAPDKYWPKKEQAQANPQNGAPQPN